MAKFLFQKSAVYCGTYHKYNCGSLYGKWVTLTDFQSPEELDEYLRGLHKDEADPEFMFQDCELMPSFVSGEPSWSEVAKTVELAAYLWSESMDEDIVNAAFRVNEDLCKESPETIEEWIIEHYEGTADKDRIVDSYLQEEGVSQFVRQCINRDDLYKLLTDDLTEDSGHLFTE